MRLDAHPESPHVSPSIPCSNGASLLPIDDRPLPVSSFFYRLLQYVTRTL